MESEKITIFLIVFVGFLLVARKLFSSGTPSSYSEQYPPQPYPEDFDPAYEDAGGPAVIGAELPFPVVLPPVQQLPNGRYNRPNVINYYFSNIDLKSGPANPSSFCDQFFVEFEAPETGAHWTNEYTVATPFGFQALMDQTGQNLVIDGTIVVVSRWDMSQIMKTVLDDVIARYAHVAPEEDDKEDIPQRYHG
jgi:hypothetical protein